MELAIYWERQSVNIYQGVINAEIKNKVGVVVANFLYKMSGEALLWSEMGSH